MPQQSSQQFNGARLLTSENALWESIRNTDSEKIQECVGRGLPETLPSLEEPGRARGTENRKRKAASVTERQHQSMSEKKAVVFLTSTSKPVASCTRQWSLQPASYLPEQKHTIAKKHVFPKELAGAKRTGVKE